MSQLEKLIGDLLLQHNCVVIPSFGGFVAQRVSAKIDAEKGTITPPRKSVLFNKQLINNDGLLVSAFAAVASISFDNAQAEIQQQIRQWNATLSMGGRITIDRVGNLFFDQEQNLCFEQDRFFNLLMESYGLSAVRFVSENDIQAKEAHQTITHVVKALELEHKHDGNQSVEPSFIINTDQSIEPVAEPKTQSSGIVVPIQKQASKAWRYVAAACLLPVAFYSVWLPVKTDVLESGVLSLSDFNPFHKTLPGNYVPSKSSYSFQTHPVRKQLDDLPKNVSVFSYEMDEDTYIPVSLKQPEPVTQAEAPAAEIEKETVEVQQVTTVPQVEKNTENQAVGQLIVGSYLNKESAQDLIGVLASKGIKSTFIESNGKVRLSVGPASAKKELLPVLHELGITPWVLK